MCYRTPARRADRTRKPLEWRGSDTLCRPLCSSFRRLRTRLRIGVSMNDPPSVRLAAKHHRHPQFESSPFRPAGDTETDQLGLDDIREVGFDYGPDLLSTTHALRELGTTPVEPGCHLLPPRLYAAKGAAYADLVAVGPQRFECGGAALCKFVFCSLKLHDECHPFGIGELTDCGIALHSYHSPMIMPSAFTR